MNSRLALAGSTKQVGHIIGATIPRRVASFSLWLKHAAKMFLNSYIRYNVFRHADHLINNLTISGHSYCGHNVRHDHEQRITTK